MEMIDIAFAVATAFSLGVLVAGWHEEKRLLERVEQWLKTHRGIE